MDVNRGSEIYAVELGDKRVKLKKEQLTTNVLAKIFDIFPDTIILISDDGYVATANSKGFFEDLDDIPIWTCQGTSCNPLAEATSSSGSSYPYQAPSKRGGKGKGKGRVQWASQHTTSYLPSLRGGSNRPPGVVAQETRLRSNVTENTTADREFQKKNRYLLLEQKWVGEGIELTIDAYRSYCNSIKCIYFCFGRGI